MLVRQIRGASSPGISQPAYIMMIMRAMTMIIVVMMMISIVMQMMITIILSMAITVVMMMMMAYRHIPTMTNSHHAQWRKQGIREIKVCKKCPKVNPYCDAICDPILIKPFLDGAKLPKFCAKYFTL